MAHAVYAVVVRQDDAAPEGQTTVLRLLVQLPGHWSCAPTSEPDRVALHVELRDGLTASDVREAVSAALRDPALRGWEWAAESLGRELRSSRVPGP